jgi:hypothetical protein
MLHSSGAPSLDGCSFQFHDWHKRLIDIIAGLVVKSEREFAFANHADTNFPDVDRRQLRAAPAIERT